MRPSTRLARNLGVALLPLALAVLPASGEEGRPAPHVLDASDPAVVRRRLLARLDAEADAACARAHLEARRILDETMPQPYLGIDAEAVEGGMRVTRVLAATRAAEAGLAVGDVILAFDGVPTPSGAALGLAVRTRRVGATYEARVRREGAERTVSVVLGKRPEEDEDEDEFFADPGGAPWDPLSFPFDGLAAGAEPAGLEPLLGGHGAPGRWVVQQDPAGASWVRQAADDATGIRFPMARVRGLRALQVVARVRFRHAGGVQDRAAGIVIRMRDEANYLVARVNAVEGDLRIFRVLNGVRRTLPGAKGPAKTDDGAWHVLEVRADGARVDASVDGGKPVGSWDTALEAGGVALWTKSDSVTDFDDLEVFPPVR